MVRGDSGSDSDGAGSSPSPPAAPTLHRQVCAECAALLHSSKPPACWNIIHLFCAGCLERMPARDALRARIRIDLGLKLVCPDCGGTEEAPGEWVDTYSVTSRMGSTVVIVHAYQETYLEKNYDVGYAAANVQTSVRAVNVNPLTSGRTCQVERLTRDVGITQAAYDVR
ncbi:hypothetical protein Bbelb_275780 [Branchiostoma belcheri]|nr:hypothetical protein Bbelb_275780 [Branchiostoma belcheri]